MPVSATLGERNMTKKRLQTIGTWFVVLTFALYAVTFLRRTLTQDERWLLSISVAITTAIAAGSFTGSLDVKYKTAWGLAASATGGFGAWFLTPILFPAPTSNSPVFVSLLLKAGGIADVGFDLEYNRTGSNSSSEPGTHGKVTISDLPSGTTELEVIGFKQAKFRIDKDAIDGKWAFPIRHGGAVTIPIIDRFAPLHEPTQDDILKVLAKAGYTKETILEVALTPEQKKEVVLTVQNRAGRDFSLWAYDCWWCFESPDATSLTLSTPFLDLIRFAGISGASDLDFNKFDQLRSTSGYFALFIEYENDGDPQRQAIGIHNLFEPTTRVLRVGTDEDASKPFTWKFIK